MKTYFNNPELKISSTVLLAIISLFLFTSMLIQKLNYDSLKNSYVNSIGAIAVKVIDKDPSLEKEVMPIITKEISKEEALEGKNLLAQYGLDGETGYSFFPYMKETLTRNNYYMVVIFLCLAITLFIFNYFQYGFFYDKVRKLTSAAKRVVEGEYDTFISEDKEGDLSKLSIAFNSMRQVIRNNINELKKEKQFLVDLLSDISHQLKTPLSSMILYNDIMLTKELTVEQRKTFLLNDKNELDKMNWLIKQLLKLARLDANAIEFSKENISLNESLLESIETFEDRAKKENINISFHETQEVMFQHDRLWLVEAFNNIIKNAIEHTPSGGEIRIEICENPVYRRIIIKDNGEGIKEKDLPNIFKRFYKVKGSKKSDSIGIGLALAKSIIEAHNGLIEVRSEMGKGAEFIITLLKY
ncbi:HAMP domain-containing sensor histidine kinase [Candidatus Clostridium radicumherbarum]|uniref:histidine kinase n=1 Tax=Candidatus Clostridium radicumherbarum TaxID=3381662 RepID=A0ABW8TWX5_9CLOT